MKAGWDAVEVESNVYHKVGSLGDDDDACVCMHGDDFMVESRIDVVQELKAMLDHKVHINVIAIIGPGQGTEAKIVKRLGILLVSRGKRNPSMRVICVSWIGAVESSSTVTRYSCNDKDNEKRIG